MDKIEKRLKQDAGKIRADVPEALKSRIDASLRATRPLQERSARKEFSFPLWLGASVTGATAAVVAIAFIGQGIDQPGSAARPANDAVARSVPEYVRHMEREFPLQVETADLTAPLEEELAKLQSDIEKARKNVEEDLDFTF